MDLELLESFADKKRRSYPETAWSSKENEKEDKYIKMHTLQSAEIIEYEFPATIQYLQDGQRYEEPDDSLYLGQEDYLESVGYSEDANITLKRRLIVTQEASMMAERILCTLKPQSSLMKK